jgi:hypothetical protein
VDPASRREQIIAGLTEHPNAALREIARAVDVPPKTLRSVRARLANSQPLRRSPQQLLELSDVLPAPTRTERWHRISPSLLGRTAPCPPASWSEPRVGGGRREPCRGCSTEQVYEALPRRRSGRPC